MRQCKKDEMDASAGTTTKQTNLPKSPKAAVRNLWGSYGPIYPLKAVLSISSTRVRGIMYYLRMFVYTRVLYVIQMTR